MATTEAKTIVTLKEIVAELKMEGKKARRILRKHYEGEHGKGNRWEFDPADAAAVKALLSKPPVEEKEPVEA